MAITTLPKLSLRLEGDQGGRVLEGSEATVLTRLITQSGSAVADADVVDVRYILFNKATLAYINSRSAVKASQTVTQSGNPAADDTVTINGLEYIFKASPTALTRQVLRTGVADTDMTALAAKINAMDPLVSAAYATPVLTVTARLPGVAGNSISLAESSSVLAVGGAALAGGTDGVDTGSNVATQRIPLLALDNVIVDTSGVAEGEQETHVLRATVRFTASPLDMDGSAILVVTSDLEFKVERRRTLAAA